MPECHQEDKAVATGKNLKKKKILILEERKKNVDPAVLTVTTRHFPETRLPDGRSGPR